MSEVMLRPMGVGDILDATFRLYRANFVTFALIGLVAYVPYALVMAPTAASQRAFGGLEEGEPVPSSPDASASLASLLGVILFSLVVMPLCGAALTLSISSAYLGESLSAWEAYTRGLPRLLPLAITNVFVGLFIVLGFMLLIVPGIYFTLWCTVVQPVVVLEKLWGIGAIRRSRELMRDNLSKGLKVVLAVGVLTWILSLAMGLLLAWVPWPHAMVGLAATYALQALILPIQTAPTLLLYYDLRIRKEAFDLEQLALSIAEAPPAASV